MKNSGIAICRHDSAKYFEYLSDSIQKKIEVLPDDNSLNTFLEKKDFQETPFCFVELNLERREMRYDGLEVIQQIRLKGLRCIIYCLSYRSSSYFDFSSPRFSLFRVSSFHRFISLPKSSSFWKEELFKKDIDGKFMSKYLYQDVLHTLLKKRSLGQEVLHELKNKLLTVKDIPDEIFLEKVLKYYFSIFNKIAPTKQDEIELIKTSLSKKLLENWNASGRQNLSSVLDGSKPELLQLLPYHKEKSSEDEINRKTRWKILFMDDDEEVRNYMERGFERNNISYIITKNGEEAIQELINNQSSKIITVFISDIRMLENGEEWQRHQGYDILHKARYEFPYFIKLIALTSGNSRLLKLMNDGNLNVKRALKQDVMGSESATNVFLKQVRELGDEMYFKSRNQPKSKTWQKGNKAKYKTAFQYYYKEHLLSFNYEDEEKSINTNAADFISNAFSEKINFTGNMTKDGPFSDTGLELFRKRQLMGRRIALALYYKNISSQEEIFKKMMRIEKGKSVSKEQVKQLFNTALALSFQKDLPNPSDIKQKDFLNSNILEEEILFLINTYKVDFDLEKIRMDDDDKFSLFDFIDTFQSKIPDGNKFYGKLEELKNLKFTTINEYKKILNQGLVIAEKLGKKKVLINIIKNELDDDLINNKILIEFLKSIV